MTARIIDGKAISAKRRAAVAERVTELKAQGINPGLAVVIVGDDPASRGLRAQQGEGLRRDRHLLREDRDAGDDHPGGAARRRATSSTAATTSTASSCSSRCPSGLDEDAVIEAIRPDKDVDGFHPESIGRLVVGKDTFVSCTPAGVMVLLEESGVDLTGKDVVVVGRSNNVGKPAALLALAQNATVTILPLAHQRPGRPRAQPPTSSSSRWGAPRWSRATGSSQAPSSSTSASTGSTTDASWATSSSPRPSRSPRRSRRCRAVSGPMTIAMLLENTVMSAARAAGLE